MLGIGEKFPLVIFAASPAKLFALNGGCKVHNSYKITPNDQISDLNE